MRSVGVLPFLLLLATLCAFTMIGAVASAGARAATAPAPDAIVEAGATLRAVPRSFLGLSIEFEELARYERLPAFGTFLKQLEPPGSGPLSLRIGGESADNTYLSKSQQLPGWSYVLTPAWFATLSKLITSVRMRVIVDLNLAVRSTSQASRMARATLSSLPAGSVQAFEVGNEPDLFRFGIVGIRKVRASSPGSFAWAFGYTPQSYVSEFDAYASALRSSAPGVTLAGPASATPATTWWSALPSGRGKLGLVSVHRYPFAACGRPNTPQYPTSAGFMSSAAATGLAQSVGRSLALAHRRHLPLRITELGSASCTGQAGATDTFATALWAPDALFSLLAAGVGGVNVHSRWRTPNTPLSGAPALQARPMFYGLVMFARMLGPGARLLRTTIQSTKTLPLSAWVVQLGDGSVRVLLINKSWRRLTVGVHVPTHSTALVQALRAPGLTATSGLTLAGQALGSNGVWAGKTMATPVPSGFDGTYVMRVPGYSAELLAAR
jgi:hypothetical protein